MNRLRLSLLLSSALATSAFACGGISDPTLGGTADGNVATVSGALTGTAVPANAHVALVWRKGEGGGVEVGTDVAVVAGHFTMNLTAPPDSYFFNNENVRGIASGSGGISGGSASTIEDPSPPPTPSAGSSGGAGAGAKGSMVPVLTPQGGTAVGGSIIDPMTTAAAGFVVYVDANGNGKLDLEGDYASSPDQILGGNDELLLAYLRGGGALDYEKLRDKSGILPAAGFNLAWTQGRWFPLNVVELKLSARVALPSPVCGGAYGGDNLTSPVPRGDDVPTDPSPPSTMPMPVPNPGDAGPSGGGSGGTTPFPTGPDLHCAPDGRSFVYGPPAGTGGDCPPPPPPHVGLCAGSGPYETTACARPSSYGQSLLPGQPVPEGWPCPVVDDALDGGSAPPPPAPDAGSH